MGAPAPCAKTKVTEVACTLLTSLAKFKGGFPMTIKSLLVAHDFSAPADRALLLAHNLAQALGAALHVAHVHPDIYDGHSDPALGLPWPTSQQTERYLRFLEGELTRIVTAALGEAGQKVQTHIVRGEPVKRLSALAAEVGADVICVGSTGKGAVARILLGSVSQHLVRMSRVPVLTVH